jgi:catechol-2,3-dioxygenase
MSGVRRLNHAVLYVRNAERSADFYCQNLGFTVAHSFPGGAFLRSADSPNDHDLGLFGIGDQFPDPPGGIGLYHLAWQVDTIDQLAEVRVRLLSVGSLVGESDHGVSKSLYAKDPDGIEFEVMWAVPREAWPEQLEARPRPLLLTDEIARWSGRSTVTESSPVG